MSEMDFFKKPPAKYAPITPHAALRAYEEGILPIEQFVFMSTSVQPLDEKQVDISAIERVLARDDLVLHDNIFLIEIFESMIGSKDPEHAVFAAESINLIEARYHQKIESLKSDTSIDTNPEIKSKIAHLFYELGLLNERRKSIKAFYMREAVTYLRDFFELKYIEREDFILLVRVLIELELFELAGDLLVTINTENTDPSLPILVAEIKFAQAEYGEAFASIKNINPDSLGEAEADLYTYWLSPNEK